MDPDLKPLPRHVQWWRRTRNQRQAALTTFKAKAAQAVILAITVAGATLISYGVWMIYPPLGFITAGLMCWTLLWSHEQDKRRKQ